MGGGLPDPTRFAGLVAIVTGAARGIGAATAQRLAAKGPRCWPPTGMRLCWDQGMRRAATRCDGA